MCYVREKDENIVLAHGKLLKKVEGCEELEILWWRICTIVSVSQFREGKCDKVDMAVDESSSFQTVVRAVYVYSAGDSAGTPSLTQNDIAERVLRGFLCYNLRRKEGSCLEGAVMPIDRLVSLLTTVIGRLVENVKREGHRQKEYAENTEETGRDSEKAINWKC